MSDMAELLAKAFSPHAHVETEERFVGRVNELAKVKGLVANPGLHLVIYGERGTGKTSLALTGTSALAPGRRIVVVCGKRHHFTDICREIALQLVEAFPKRLIYDASAGTIRCDGATFPTATIGRDVIRVLLPKGAEPFVIVIDEVDTIQHPDSQAELAEFAKYLSTVLQNVHLAIVGVSRTANLLLAGHESNVRTLHQVSLDRMPDAEMLLVLQRGLDVLSLGIDANTRDELLALADRSPYYLHLIARAAAEKTLDRHASTLEAFDLQEGLKAVAVDADAELRNEYDVAVASGKGSLTFEYVLHALANLNAVRVPTGAVVEEVRRIVTQRGDDAVTPARIGQALKELSGAERRRIVSTERQVWWFTKPMMRTYIRLRERVR